MSESKIQFEDIPARVHEFSYPKMEKHRGIKRVLRRLKQTGQVLLSPAFSSDHKLRKEMVERYDTEQEVEFYVGLLEYGFDLLEQLAVLEASKKLPRHAKTLVVGSGTGREAFAFERIGYEVTGIDVSIKMVTEGNKKLKELGSQLDLKCCDAKDLAADGETYDFIWLSQTIDCHIQGRKNRVQFLREIRKLCHQTTIVAVTPEILEVPWHHRFSIGSQLLRLRWAGKSKWEPGDTVNAFLGNHNDTARLIYLHYYPSNEEFLSVLKEAGFVNAYQVPQTFTWLMNPKT